MKFVNRIRIITPLVLIFGSYFLWHTFQLLSIPAVKTRSSVVLRDCTALNNTLPIKSFPLIGITYASNAGDGFCNTIRSASANGIPLIVVGWGQSSDKLDKSIGFLEATKWLTPTTVGIFFDSFDVLFQRDVASIYKDFIAMGSDIVVSAEKNCWPFEQTDQLCLTYPQNEKVTQMYSPGRPVRYLNGGGMISTIESARKWYEEAVRRIKADEAWDDQQLGHDLFLSGQFPAKLDVYSKLFQSMHESMEDLELEPNSNLLRNKRTGSVPALFHFNGDKSPLLGFIEKLWFNKIASIDYPLRPGFYLGPNDFVDLHKICSE